MRRRIRRWLLVLATLSRCATAHDAMAQGTTVPRVRDSNVGYIDPAIPDNVLRLRVDAARDNIRPTRAQFFWSPGAPNGNGPSIPETSVDYQDVSLYCEALVTPSISGFVNLPVRFLDPQQNPNTAGLADIDLGFKGALIDREDLVATFQLRTYVPTGDVDRGLGNDHVSLEPALLVYKPLAECWGLEGELRDWIPIDGTDFAGNIIRYGLGVHYDLFCSPAWQLVPVVEFVGWTVLDGKVSMPQGSGSFLIDSAAGDTILNVKAGVRLKCGEGIDVYTGFGHPLTGDTWYDDIYHFEVRFFF